MQHTCILMHIVLFYYCIIVLYYYDFCPSKIEWHLTIGFVSKVAIELLDTQVFSGSVRGPFSGFLQTSPFCSPAPSPASPEPEPPAEMPADVSRWRSDVHHGVFQRMETETFWKATAAKGPNGKTSKDLCCFLKVWRRIQTLANLKPQIFEKLPESILENNEAWQTVPWRPCES